NVILIAMALAVGFVVAEVIFKAMRPFLIRFIAKLPKVQTKSRRGKSA
ncbi:membrane protein, partial [Lacticaseibacillus rhamnosus]